MRMLNVVGVAFMPHFRPGSQRLSREIVEADHLHLLLPFHSEIMNDPRFARDTKNHRENIEKVWTKDALEEIGTTHELLETEVRRVEVSLLCVSLLSVCP